MDPSGYGWFKALLLAVVAIVIVVFLPEVWAVALAVAVEAGKEIRKTLDAQRKQEQKQEFR